MALDLKYEDFDRVVVNGNYDTYTGALYKAARLLMSEYTLVDGEPFGNRMFTELRGATDTPENRLIAKYHCENALRPLVEAKEISDLVVTVDDPTTLDGLGVLVEFRDVAANRAVSISVPAAWAME